MINPRPDCFKCANAASLNHCLWWQPAPQASYACAADVPACAQSNPGQWVAWWEQLARDINADPVTRARVIADVLNEPDAHGMQCARTVCTQQLAEFPRYYARKHIIGSICYNSAEPLQFGCASLCARCFVCGVEAACQPL